MSGDLPGGVTQSMIDDAHNGDPAAVLTREDHARLEERRRAGQEVTARRICMVTTCRADMGTKFVWQRHDDPSPAISHGICDRCLEGWE